MATRLDVADTPDQIAYCLNCTRPPGWCKRCGGPPVQHRRRQPRNHSKAFPADVRDRALALVDAGMLIKYAAREVGAGKSTVARWIRERKDAVEWAEEE